MAILASDANSEVYSALEFNLVRLVSSQPEQIMNVPEATGFQSASKSIQFHLAAIPAATVSQFCLVLIYVHG